MSGQIFISRFGQRFGPYTLDRVNSLIHERVLFANDLVWYEGLDEWIPLNTVPGVNVNSAPHANFQKLPGSNHDGK